ncbi:MAG TPA: hypothetical protein VMX14_11985 [Anaerolineae bacterium]|nr:hypothetical protein [Anaerolineae bacterium]
MSVGNKIIAWVVEVVLGFLVGGVAVPVVWFIIRILGLIRPLGMALGLDWLMFLGGIVIGALAGGITVRAIMASLYEEDKLNTVLGAVGGAVSGFLSSIMFFPIVAIL